MKWSHFKMSICFSGVFILFAIGLLLLWKIMISPIVIDHTQYQQIGQCVYLSFCLCLSGAIFMGLFGICIAPILDVVGG